MKRRQQFCQSRFKKMNGAGDDEEVGARGRGELIRECKPLLAPARREVLQRLALERQIVNGPDEFGREMKVPVKLKEQIADASAEIEDRPQFGRDRHQEEEHGIVAFPR